MKCPLNANVKDNFGCERCYSVSKLEPTRAGCVIVSKAEYIKDETIEPEIKEDDGNKQGPEHNRRGSRLRKKNLTTCP